MRRARSPRPRPRLICLLALALAGLALSLGAGQASAQCAEPCSPRPWWRLDASAAPTNLVPGDSEAQVIVTASNLGDAPVDASKHSITVSDVLPPGLKAISVSGELGDQAARMSCPSQTELKEKSEKNEAQVSCTYDETLEPYEVLEVTITVEVQAGLTGSIVNDAKIAGGEGPSGQEPQTQQLESALTVSSAATPFGIERLGLSAEDEDGSPDTQAGSHPFQLTTALDLNQAVEVNQGGPYRGQKLRSAPALVKDLQFNLPPGLVGDPQATAQCAETDFTAIENAANACPANTAVGVAIVTINEPFTLGVLTEAVPVFNLPPAPGEPARFGFFALHVSVVLDTSVRTGRDYGVVVSVKNATQTAEVLSTQVTLWGQPGAASHDRSRGWACVERGKNHQGESATEPCVAPEPRATTPFLTLPTSCSAPLETSVLADSWREPGRRLADGEIDLTDPRWIRARSTTPALEGCERLPFDPSIDVQPDEHSATTPSGLNVAVKVPQAGTLSASSLAQADVKDTTLTLPEGVQLSPGAADGLVACSAAQIGLSEGFAEIQQTENDHFTPDPATCPEQVGLPSSKVGTVSIKTPLLPNELEGSVYLAEQDTNPFKAPLVLYLIARDPVSGVLVKLAGKVTPEPVSGRLVSSFENTPPLPFEELKLHFFNGPRASVSTPPLCGSYQTTSSFTPWSDAVPATPSSRFQITSGPSGGGCPSNPQPLSPSFQAGSTHLQAGAFSPFALNIARPDEDQALSSITIHLPPGLAAILSSVSPCPEPQAAQGTCGPQSLIGHTSASSGLGPVPYTLDGEVYFTGPYGGAPFGLSIVTPAVAGPFNLGTVVVRSAISVDRNTAAVTVAGAVPTMVETATSGATGIPIQLKKLTVTVDRPGFEFNPTNCEPMAITGTLAGAQGASANVSSRFQVANCSALPFHPKLTASTKGQASKANGANFAVKVESKGLGQANIAKVRLQLPKALPARLTTLQKACTEGAFNANPASCPEGSVIGQATIHTPVLSSPLTGPAYLVSHGGAAFPDVEFVLQGEGITLALDGKTQIKNQTTYSKFESAPDAPFTTFETVLPAGPHSALTTNLPEKAHFNFCKSSLSMPTEIVGQNGAVIKQTTKIALQGCRKVKAPRPLSRAQLLKRALVACRKQHGHSKTKRQACEKHARTRYAASKAAHGLKKTRGHR